MTASQETKKKRTYGHHGFLTMPMFFRKILDRQSLWAMCTMTIYLVRGRTKNDSFISMIMYNCKQWKTLLLR